MKEGKYLCASKLVIWGWKEIGKWDIPKEHYRVDENCTDLHVVELKTSSLCLSLSPSLFLLFCFYFKFPTRMPKDTITLYNILVSQIYCSSLPDVQKVKWLSQGHWVYISPATGKRGLVNQNSLGVNFPENVFAETWKNWQVAGFFFFFKWSKVFLTVVIYSLTHSISKYLLNTDCYGQDPIFGWKTNFFTQNKLLPLRSLYSIGKDDKK